eukprot:s109_g22.t1
MKVATPFVVNACGQSLHSASSRYLPEDCLRPLQRRLASMKRTASLLGGLGSALAVALSADATGNDCPCSTKAAAAAQQSLLEASSVLGEASRLDIRQELQGSGGLSAQDVAARFGGSRLSEEQHHRGLLLRAAETTLACLDDRILEPALTTPGGELGEFTTALAAYLQEKDGSSGSPPNQEVVDSLLGKYLDTVHGSGRFRHMSKGNASVAEVLPPPAPPVAPPCVVCLKPASHSTPFQSATVIQTPRKLQPTLENLRRMLELGAFTLACFCVLQWRGSATTTSQPIQSPHLDLDASLTVCGVGRYQLTIALAIMLAWMADGAENVLLHNMSPHLVEALDTDEISLADLRMFCHIAMACSAFLSGSCADSFGRRPVFCISCLLAATFSLLSIFAPVFWIFCLCRVLTGVGLGALVGTDVALLCEFLPVSKREWLAALEKCYVLGRLYADFCTAKVYPLLENWRAPFLLCSLPLVPSCLLRFGLHETPQALLARGLVGHAKFVLTAGLDFRNCLNAGFLAAVRQNHLERVLAISVLAVAVALGRILDSVTPEVEAHFNLHGNSFSSPVWCAALTCLW